jgi:hypothetical protein
MSKGFVECLIESVRIDGEIWGRRSRKSKEGKESRSLRSIVTAFDPTFDECLSRTGEKNWGGGGGSRMDFLFRFPWSSPDLLSIPVGKERSRSILGDSKAEWFVGEMGTCSQFSSIKSWVVCEGDKDEFSIFVNRQ